MADGPDRDALTAALVALGSGRDLRADEAHAAVSRIIDGDAPEVAVAAFLAALRVRGETDAELAGAVEAVRDRMSPFETPRGPVIDTCGTGGDGAATVNVSTAAAIVAASCGLVVAKHGNRSASGVSGSSEVLERLGVAIDPGPEVLARCLDRLGIAFFYAPSFHPALRHAAGVRKQLPFRTIFNLIGPLANPARPSLQLVGTPGERPAALIASALARLGIERAAVVTGEDGLDEVSLAGPTRVLWVEGGRIDARTWTPEAFGLPRVDATELRVRDPQESADRIGAMLGGAVGPVRHVVLANTAAALLVAGRAASPAEGAALAAEAIDSGRAATLRERWADLSHGRD